MKKYIYGESAFLIFIQWFLLVIFCSVFLFFGSKLVETADLSIKLVLIYFGIVFFFSFVLYHKIFKLNLIKEIGDRLLLLNFIRKINIKKEEVVDLRISWLALNGIIYTSAGKKYSFPLDGGDVKKVLCFGYKEVEMKYKERLKKNGINLK